MGPLISAAQLASVSAYLPEGPADASEGVIACRGDAPSGPGFWFAPTVLAPISPGARAFREEIFGPIVSVVPFEDEADAIRIANDTVYGLSGSLWTTDLGRALRVARALETGALSVNSNSSVRYSTPFGGFKQSGIGRELGPDALESFTELKNVRSGSSCLGCSCVAADSAADLAGTTADGFAAFESPTAGADNDALSAVLSFIACS